MVLGPASAGGVCGAQSQIGVKLGAHTKSLGSSVSQGGFRVDCLNLF